ncbi:AAA family ATPase [Pimelobacter simplex]|uniref:AAA family ATPase n=1 Tax=Nocardioides simplex TaxID=2045 RepID=UPI0020B16CC1|nr:AAA family ATPase [Pimelobacter simplex]
MTTLNLPELGLVVLVGVSGSGKSTFAREHFKATEVVSSDFCRGLVADDENDQDATPDAFDVLHYIAGTRLRRGLLTVVDATNVQQSAREELVRLARSHASSSTRSSSTSPRASPSSAIAAAPTATSATTS